MTFARERERRTGRGEPRIRRGLLAAALLAGGAAAALWPLARKAVEHRIYQLSYDASVETWTLPLPLGYRVMRQQSVPPAPHDGFRLLRADSAE